MAASERRQGREFRVGDLVRIVGPCPGTPQEELYEDRSVGIVESLIPVKNPSREYLRRWGRYAYAWVIIRGERWSLGPESIEVVG